MKKNKFLFLAILMLVLPLTTQASNLWDDIKKDAQKAWDGTKENAGKVGDDATEAYDEKDKAKNVYEETKSQGWKPVKPKEDEVGIPVE